MVKMDIESEWALKKEQFVKLWPQNNNIEVENIWEMLTRHYSESTRFYHTREHILECLQKFNLIKELLKSSDTVQMSIWFHDVIFDIKANDNEEKSALFFSQIANNILTDDVIKQVSELIRSTKHLTSKPDFDQAYLLDIDLGSFGSEQDKFFLDGENLRKEVPHLSDDEFTKKQIKFLQMLLNRKQIFFTDYFHDKYESIARTNINLQIQEMLKSN